MLLHPFFLLLHSAGIVLGLRDDYVVHEIGSARAHLHRQVEPDLILPIRIALVQQNIDGAAEEQLLSLSDPDSTTYGKFWTPEKTKAFFAPSTESVEAVEEWLQTVGLLYIKMSCYETH
jgi:tripeptidyl-peptidase-1